MKTLHINFRGKYGLSNRIRAMSGYYAVAKICDFDLSFSWQPDESCPGMFQDAFNKIPGFNYVDTTYISKSESDLIISSGSKPTTCGSHPEAIYEAHIDNQIIENNIFNGYVSEFYRQLKPTTEIINITNQISRHLFEFKEKTLGVHIRRTDMIDHSLKLGIAPPSDDILISEIEKYISENDTKSIYVAADNPNSIALIYNAFPGLVKSLDTDWQLKNQSVANDSTIQARLTDLVTAVADLYLLSRCSYIIGTRLSSFSTFAASWGNVPYKRV